MGDYRLLVDGGIDAQPAGRWKAARHAAYVWRVLEEANKPTFKFGEDCPLDADELETLAKCQDVEVDKSRPEWLVEDDED